MRVLITTPHNSVTVETTELSRIESSVLLSLTVPEATRIGAFEPLNFLKPFKKIERHELCPEHHPAKRMQDLKIETFPIAALQDTDFDIEAVLPGSERIFKLHKVSGHCVACGVRHTVTRTSVVVRVMLNGVSVQNIYQVEEVGSEEEGV